MVFVDHNDALGTLNALLAKTSVGGGQLALISGGLATGKTSLLHEFTRQASESGAVSLMAVGSAAESKLQLAVMEQLFRVVELPDDLAERLLEPLAAVAATVDEGDHDIGAGRYAEPGLVRAAREVCGALLELSRERPVVIGIDDVQFVDSTSLQLLLYLWRRLSSARVMLVVSEWATPESTLPRFHAELFRQPHRRLRLGPLDVRGVVRHASRFLPEDEAKRVAPDVHRSSAGNPLLVAVLVQEHLAASREGGHGAPGDLLGPEVVAALHRWGTPLLETACGLAVLCAKASPNDVARLVGLPLPEVRRALELLVSAGLMEGCGLRHPAVAKALLDSLPRTRRTRLHADAADLLRQVGAPAVEVADHLLEAAGPHADWVVDVLREAADVALAGDRVETAVRYLELALDTCTDPGQRVSLAVAVVRASWRVRPSRAGVARQLVRTAAAEGELSDRDGLATLREALWHGDTTLALGIMDSLAGADREVDTQLVVEARLVYLWVHGAHRERVRDLGPAHQRAADNPWTRAASLLGNVWTQGVSEALTVTAEHLLHSSRLGDATLETMGTALIALGHGNRAEKAAAWCDRLVEEAARRGATAWQAYLSDVRARLALLMGDLADAVASAESALELMPPADWGVCVGSPLGTLALAQVASGRLDAAEETLRRPTPDAMAGTSHGLWFLRARGLHHLASDRVLAAVGDLQECGAMARERGADVPALLPWRTDLAEAHLRLGDPLTARDLVRHQLERVSGTDRRTTGLSLRVLAGCGEVAKRPALLAQAVDALQQAGDRFELSRALQDLSRAHHELGDVDRARVFARRAAHEAKECRAGLPAQAEVLVGAEPGGPPGEAAGRGPTPSTAAVLSDAEIRVAQLAGLGHTNREIGRRLYITVSTVEQHLTRVYRKLGVTSRSELPAVLVRHDIPPA
ncbi:AAA family ATPase [Actinosynnema sp. NPDC002837]